jgi:hypothetical protein
MISLFYRMYSLSSRNLNLSLLGLGGLTLVGLLTMRYCPYFWKKRKMEVEKNQKVETS